DVVEAHAADDVVEEVGDGILAFLGLLALLLLLLLILVLGVFGVLVPLVLVRRFLVVDDVLVVLEVRPVALHVIRHSFASESAPRPQGPLVAATTGAGVRMI